MTQARPSPQPSLVRILSTRLVVTGIVGILLQIGIVAVRSYLDDIDLMSNYVKYEARLIYDGFSSARAGRRGGVPARYSNEFKDAYGFRVLDSHGRVLSETNGALLIDLSPWQSDLPSQQDFWLRRLDGSQWMNVAGGLRFSRGAQDVWVEVATTGDPAGEHFRIFARELLSDVWMPMIPLIVLTLGVAILTVRSALQPLVHAAEKADTLAVLDRSEHLDVTNLPREAESLATAINRLLDRVANLIKSQRLFTARAAHELRTPLSIMLLELERSDSPHIRQLESDVRAMSNVVDRLLTLSRLENIEKPELKSFDLAELAGILVDRMKEWAMKSEHRIELAVTGPAVLKADRFAIREALRNLIENAVKHTPPGTLVRVQIGPGSTMAVDDAGPGLDLATAHTLLEPFARGSTTSEGAGLGLSIVAQAASLHGAEITITRSDLGGTRFEIRFPDPPQAE
jgi:signal transduction histidine kinase